MHSQYHTIYDTLFFKCFYENKNYNHFAAFVLIVFYKSDYLNLEKKCSCTYQCKIVTFNLLKLFRKSSSSKCQIVKHLKKNETIICVWLMITFHIKTWFNTLLWDRVDQKSLLLKSKFYSLTCDLRCFTYFSSVILLL